MPQWPVSDDIPIVSTQMLPQTLSQPRPIYSPNRIASIDAFDYHSPRLAAKV
jgi:hypothetical protein